MALGEYIGPYLNIQSTTLALAAVLTISFLHSLSLRKSSVLQLTTTLLKVVLIVILIFSGWSVEPEKTAFLWDGNWQNEVLLPGFAVSFVFVTFSYSGWNAAAYIVDEIKAPRKNLPRALFIGTLIVSVTYSISVAVGLTRGSIFYYGKIIFKCDGICISQEFYIQFISVNF